MSKHSNYLPSNDQLAALAKGCVPKNTIKNTEGWINIIKQWRSDINYNEPLESQDKKMIELQVSQFLCGVTTKQDQFYLQTSLKNALSAINRHFQNIKPGWRYNLHNKNDFPDLYARFDGLLKDMKKKGLGESKSTDGLTTEEIWHILNHEILDPNTLLGLLKRVFFWISILGAARGSEHANLHVSQVVDTSDGIILKKAQQKNNQGGIEGNQVDLIIPFSSDLEGTVGPNSDIRKYLSFRPKNFQSSSFYFSACCSPDVPENTGHAISGHKSSGGYYAYAKPTDEHKREALGN
ncbi:36216_t:CDS:2, partial [Racocetra persica]